MATTTAVCDPKLGVARAPPEAERRPSAERVQVAAPSDLTGAIGLVQVDSDGTNSPHSALPVESGLVSSEPHSDHEPS